MPKFGRMSSEEKEIWVSVVVTFLLLFKVGLWLLMQGALLHPEVLLTYALTLCVCFADYLWRRLFPWSLCEISAGNRLRNTSKELQNPVTTIALSHVGQSDCQSLPCLPSGKKRQSALFFCLFYFIFILVSCLKVGLLHAAHMSCVLHFAANQLHCMTQSDG